MYVCTYKYNFQQPLINIRTHDNRAEDTIFFRQVNLARLCANFEQKPFVLTLETSETRMLT
jgi:hypothetical protein